MDEAEYLDYYNIDALLTGEERDQRDSVRQFVDEKCMPIIADHFDKGTFPMELIPRMADMGLFGVHVTGYGCHEMSHTIYGLVCQELGRLMDESRVRHTQISLAKMNNVREAMKIARSARDMLGARGILADHQVIRHLCDLEAISSLEGTESIHTLVLGQDLTGISAFF